MRTEVSHQENQKEKREESQGDSLVSRFNEWIGLYPNATGIFAAKQAWFTLVEQGVIHDGNIGEVFAGLERWERS